MDANRDPRVAFQGEHGAFSEDAIRALFGGGAAPVPSATVLAAALAVADGTVDAAVLPIENTVAGSVVDTYDALAQCRTLYAVAEVVVPVHLCLMAANGATLDAIEIVESHPIALAQCTKFFARHANLRACAAADTAGAARNLAASPEPGRAAIAGRMAALRYGLDVLAENIEDRPDNQTRFLQLARQPALLAEGRAARTIISFETPNQPGALLRVLEPLAEYGMNLSKIESRPTGRPWTYQFCAEFDHRVGDPARDRALATIARVTLALRVIGLYARAEGPTAAAPG